MEIEISHAVLTAGVEALHEKIWLFIITPVVGGIIGWITNVVAIRMLFHPREPVRIPLSPWTIQGLLPKRKADIARSVANAVANELVPVDSLLNQVDYPKFKGDIIDAIVRHVDQRITDALPAFIPASLNHVIRKHISDLVNREADSLIDGMMKNVREKVVREVDIKALVESQILSFDIVRLEELVVGIANTELKAIEILGGILGFVIGIFQAVFIFLLE